MEYKVASYLGGVFKAFFRLLWLICWGNLISCVLVHVRDRENWPGLLYTRDPIYVAYIS